MRTVYLDIETKYVGHFKPPEDRFFRDSRHHIITVLGLLVVDGTQEEFVQLVGSAATKQALLTTLGDAKRIVTYNGRSIPDPGTGKVGFDFPVIAAQLGVVLDQQFRHTDLVHRCWELGLYGGLKKVEEKVGLCRTLPGKDGRWAMEMWLKYEATGDRKPLEELLHYNREDVYMLRELEAKLVNWKR
jgi:uncharacterized protein YprB with RNaseH-like and TPR domain